MPLHLLPHAFRDNDAHHLAKTEEPTKEVLAHCDGTVISKRLFSTLRGWMSVPKGKKNLHMLLDMVTEGDTIITLEVSRLSRSTQQLCEIEEVIKSKKLRIIIVGSITVDCRNGQIDPMSQAFIQMCVVFAEFELPIIRARVRSGMQNAKSKGVKVGRRPTTKDDIPAVFYEHCPAFSAGKRNLSELTRMCDLSRPTVYKYLKLTA